MVYSVKKSRKALLSLLHSLSPDDVAKSPEKDFSRNRKCTLFDTVLMLLTMAGHTIRSEIDNYFIASKKDIPSKSAFLQQRGKFSPNAFHFIFSRFNELLPFKKTFMGLHLLACDGSDLNIPYFPGDTDSFILYNSRNGGYFQMHLNALFDLTEKRYVDAILCPRRKMGENRSLCEMIDRNPLTGPILYIADRGYASFNTIAHIINAGQFFLFRAKDAFGGGSFLKGILFPDTDEFDIDHTFILTRKKVRKDQDPTIFKNIRRDRVFDFIDPDDKSSTFTIRLRIVKTRIGDGTYEYLITNLPRKKLTPKGLKELYRLRWGIETSFRQLKYNLALSYFHSKKREFIEQEVFARLVMYNFISLAVGNIEIEQDENCKYDYQIAFSDSVNLCRKCLLGVLGVDKLKALLSQRLSPIRPNRSFPRNIRSQRLRTLNNRA